MKDIHSDSTSYTSHPWNRNGVVRFIKVRPTIPISATVEIDITLALERIKEIQKKLGSAVSLHALLIHWLSQTARKHPLMRSYKKGRRVIEFADVNVCTTIMKKGSSSQRELKVHVFRSAQSKDAAELQQELRKEMKTSVVEGSKAGISSRVGDLFRYIRMRYNPLPFNRQYGNILISNIESLGVHVPLFPIVPTPYTFALFVGPVFQRLVMDEEGSIDKRRCISIVAMADHTIMDGYPLAAVARTFVEYAGKGYGLDGKFVERMKGA